MPREESEFSEFKARVILGSNFTDFTVKKVTEHIWLIVTLIACCDYWNQMGISQRHFVFREVNLAISIVVVQGLNRPIWRSTSWKATVSNPMGTVYSLHLLGTLTKSHLILSRIQAMRGCSVIHYRQVSCCWDMGGSLSPFPSERSPYSNVRL